MSKEEKKGRLSTAFLWFVAERWLVASLSVIRSQETRSLTDSPQEHDKKRAYFARAIRSLWK